MVCSRLSARRAVRVGFLVASVIVMSVTASTAAPAPQLAERQAQADILDAQLSKLEERYSGLQERSRGVRIELVGLRSDTRDAQSRLAETRRQLEVAQDRLRERAMAMYRGDSTSMLVEFTAAGSVSDIFDRIDASQRISQQDAAMFEEVRDLKIRVAARESKLRRSLKNTQRLSRKLERDSRAMASLVAKRRDALASARADVRALMEQQRRAAAAQADVSSKSRAEAIAAGEDPAVEDGTPTMSDGAQEASSGSSGADDSSSQPPAPSTSIPLPPSSGTAAAAASIAMGKIGAPYVWAAAGPNSFDCSGLVVWAFAQAGRPGLPHSTYSLIGMGIEVPLSEAQPGDLVFTNNTGHMGIYVGGGSMVHSPRTGRTVSVEPLTYYSVVAVRRI